MSTTLCAVGRLTPIEWRITRPPTCGKKISSRTKKRKRRQNIQANCKCDNEANEVNGYDLNCEHEETQIIGKSNVLIDDSDDDVDKSDDHETDECKDRNNDVADNEEILESNEDDILLYQKSNTHNCDFVDCRGFQEMELLCSENDFTLKNSFWFSIGTLMQGSDLNLLVCHSFYYN